MRCLVSLLLLATVLNGAVEIKPVPPPGIAIPADERTELTAGLQRLRTAIDRLKDNKAAAALLPDVLIFWRAVDSALRYEEFYAPEEFGRAKELLRAGQERADALAQGKAPWTTATGLVVRGYVSKIDGSVQPYGLVVPPEYSPTQAHLWRLDTWFHGRGEKLTELNFLHDRMRNRGEFTPPRTIVLHLYGRYCNANKFAGEVDLFEALDAVKRQYPIDEDRIVARGFSMGGAATWHIAAHHAGLWAAAAPGAGFSETAEYLGLPREGQTPPPWWEQKLWHLYDAAAYAANLFNVPVVAYSGEIDKQKQAADVMAREMRKEGMRLAHLIGPQTAHKYHPETKIELSNKIDALAEAGRDRYPRKVRFTTWTLAYNRMKWVQVDALDRHWEKARVQAEVLADHTIDVKTENVRAFTLDTAPGARLLDAADSPIVKINGQAVQTAGTLSDGSWSVHFRREGNQWRLTETPLESGLQKRHGLQGPIDDAFLDRFIMVRPTGSPMVPALNGWVDSEMNHAIREWRKQFRGEAMVKNDSEITDADLANSNLVLWGDPGSNRILARIADKLPIRWTAAGIQAGEHRYAAGQHAAILIYPNPLNPNRYVVLNSGVTFREAHYLTNAQQTPKLPDFAIVDISVPADAYAPGKIVEAGFFGERWELLAGTAH